MDHSPAHSGSAGPAGATAAIGVACGTNPLPTKLSHAPTQGGSGPEDSQ